MLGTVTILTGGPGLGFYVPGAIVARQLGREQPVELIAIEELLPAAKQAIVRDARQAFHRDFRLALMAQRLARDITGELDSRAVADTLRRWATERRTRFVVFSGFWGPLVERHLDHLDASDVVVDYCHVDAVASTSWSLVTRRGRGVRDVWFPSWEERRQVHWIDVSGEPPLRWNARSGRYLAHGGGWGMGTYRERVRGLDAGVLDILCYEPAELAPADPLHRLYLDPEWFPWSRGDSLFPPLGELDPSGALRYTASADFPALFQVTRRASAVISKPGGGTLVDCFAAATPLILLEPFGEYERKNGLLWRELGFAVDFDEWVAGGCRADVLEMLHDNLLAARARVRNYAQDCCAPDDRVDERVGASAR